MRTRLIAIAATITALAAACGDGTPDTGTADATQGARSATPLRWVAGRAEAANGAAVRPTATAVCGSDNETYLTEMTHVAPTDIKVLREWSDIVRGGKQVMVTGTVETVHLGPADLPMSHVYGDDLSMNVTLDPPFRPFSIQLGDEQGEEKPGSLHVEISSGLIPHRRLPGGTAGETWRQASDRDLTGFVEGFESPAVGDRVAIMGRWIIDCGHGDYAAELHPMAFLAWAHRSSDTTVVHAYYNPYRDTELFGPDASVLGRVGDAARLDDPGTKPFPPYFVDEVLRLISGEAERLRSQELMETTRTSPAPWQVCAPAGTRGKHLVVRYDLVARPGVQVAVTPDRDSGCVTLRTVLTDDYRPLDAAVRMCALPWGYLDEIASGALGTPIDVSGLVKTYVPEASWPLIDRDPTTACADPLSGPTVSGAPDGTRVRRDATQPFPFYGVVSVRLTDAPPGRVDG